MSNNTRHELSALLRLAGPLGAASYNLVSIFCVGVMAAVGNLVAIRHGAGDGEGVRHMTQAGIWVAAGLALLAGILLWWMAPLPHLAGQQAGDISGAMGFLHSLVFALPGYLLFMALRGFTSA